jgi:hypothetical protein
MLKIHTADGKTHRLDIQDREQAKALLGMMKQRDFQATITGVSIVGEAGSRIRCPSCDRAGRLVCQGCGAPVANEARTTTGVQYSLSKPDGYQGPVYYTVEEVASDPAAHVRGGERVTCFAGDSRIQMMVHRGQPSVRITLVKTGRQRYNPLIE